MAEKKKVEVIPAKPPGFKLDAKGSRIERLRVAAYVRVSTDSDEQIHSFVSQKEHYQNLIRQKKDWALVGVYADEGITGTSAKKRDQFLRMIADCQSGKIDIVITKSISRFSRNLVDTLNYVRLLKSIGVTVIFEKENIDTSTMESEMQLALLSSIAQNEVESLSKNVKMGIRMKMIRGEMVGFNGCLGYDYHKEDKTLTINEDEAETVRFIFERYTQGLGCYMIARELTNAGRKNKQGIVFWRESSVRSVLKNEKYKGDLLLEKTFTTDPITKQRLKNHGEADQYYIKDHHPAIIEAEVWDQAAEIMAKRRCNKEKPGLGRSYTTQYAFSSKLECAYCGGHYSRRSHNQTKSTVKPVWKCVTQSKKGKAQCPHSKAIDEKVIEGAFQEVLKELVINYDDVLEHTLEIVEAQLKLENGEIKVRKNDRAISDIEKQRNTLLELRLAGEIKKDVYESKDSELEARLNALKIERKMLKQQTETKDDIRTRIDKIRAAANENDIFGEFDRTVFEHVVEKIVIGGTGDDGVDDPYRLTFVLSN